MKRIIVEKAAIWLFIGIVLLNSCSEEARISFNNQSDPATYYVSVEGKDTNPGTYEEPFKSINGALRKIVPGDTVLVRGGVYYEKISFPKSGTPSKRITIKAFPEERPVIDGTHVTVEGWMALVTMENARNITFEGFDICNLSGSAPDIDPEGIRITGNSSDITIKDCNIYNIKNNYPTFGDGGWRSAHGIFVLGNGSTSISNLTITGCNIHDLQTGTSETITLAGNIDGFTISNNKIYNIENIGIIVAGGDNLFKEGDLSTNFARNGVICDNELFNVSHTLSPKVWGETSYGAIAIYVCGGANTVIERNKVYNSDRGIGLVSESNDLATKDCIVRNNFVYNCYRTGIYMGDYINYTSGGTENCYVLNNTLFFNNSVLGYFGEIEGEIRLTENCTNNVIKNNIVYGRPTDVFIHKYNDTGSGNIIDNNFYYTSGTSKWIWEGKEFHDFEEWKIASGQDNYSINGIPPKLVSKSLPDLHLQISSPARNNGQVISEDLHGSKDIDGSPRIVNDQISIGAHQVN